MVNDDARSHRDKCWCCRLMLIVLLLFGGFLTVYFLENILLWARNGNGTAAFSAHSVNVGKTDAVHICVRDYACADGDRVRLSVNNNQVFSGEIDWRDHCMTAAVTAGDNALEIYAINGAGRDAYCPNIINTGELGINGGPPQRWALPPGGVATLQVKVNP